MDLSEAVLHELASISGVALGHESLSDALDEICRIGVRVIDGCEGASLTTVSEQGPRAVASSDPWAESLDEMQYEEREGPCFDAARSGVGFRVPRMDTEPRWPSYMPRAVANGARSMVSLPMSSESKLIGALNMYAREPEAFGADEVSLAEVVAAHASLASQVASTLSRHRAVADQLRTAMASRAAIEQAKGIIMATSNCDADRAFDLLVKQSQHENRKLREVAVELVERRRSGPTT